MMKLNYGSAGDYQIPDIALSTKTEPIGVYGRMHREYLRQTNPMLFEDLVLTERLYPLLLEVEQAAQKRRTVLMEQYLEQNPAPDKKLHQMEWVRHMNTIRVQVEEIIVREIVYC